MPFRSDLKVRSHMRGRRRAENWLQHKSLHVFTHARSRIRGGAGAKSAPQEMGPTPNLPRALRNRALQTIIVLKKWQIRPRPLRVCSASAPRMCEHTHGSGAGMSKSARLRSATAPAHVWLLVWIELHQKCWIYRWWRLTEIFVMNDITTTKKISFILHKKMIMNGIYCEILICM